MNVALSACNVLALCAGVGSLELGIKLAVPGARLICAVERDSYAAAVLVARMADQALEDAPVWDDVVTFDGRPWRGVVDLVSAGFPCQPFSVAGKRRGTDDERWLWPDIARVLREVRPRYVFLENSPELVRHGLADILTDLAALGMSVEWDVFSAAEAGAPHERQRLYLLADAGCGQPGWGQLQPVAERDGAADAGESGQRTHGVSHVSDAGHAERREATPSGHERHGDHARREEAPSSSGGSGSDGSEEASGDVPDPNGRGCRALERDDDARRGQPDATGRRAGDVRDTQGAGCGRSGQPVARVWPDAGRSGGAPAAGAGISLANPDGPQRARYGSALGAATAQPAIERPCHDALFPRPWPPHLDDDAGWRELLAIDPRLESAVRRDADGLASRLDRIRCIGNGVVPVVSALAFRTLHARLAGALL